MKIIGMGVCGGGEADRYLRKTLDNFKKLCDTAVIATCNATDKEREMIAEYDFIQYDDDREWGWHQPTIKTDLLKRAGEHNPDWIVALDMDEVFEDPFTRAELEKWCSLENHIAFKPMIVNHCDDEKHYWRFGCFPNVRIFKYATEFGTQFLRKNVHCGLAPPAFYRWGWEIPVIVHHYGLMRAEDRAKKVERYKKYDPRHDKVGIGWYYTMIDGRMKSEEFDYTALHNKLVDIYKKTKPRETKPNMSQKHDADINTFVPMRAPDGRVVNDIREKDVQGRLNEGWEVVKEEEVKEEVVKPRKTPKKTTRKKTK